MLNSYDFIIRVNGKAYPLSTGFSFNRDIKAMGSGFEIQLIDPDQELIKAFRPSTECQIEIDGEILAKGKFGAVSIDDKNGHVYTYPCRDRAGDLIDCSAMFSDGGFERSNITLEAAVKDVLKPFKMPLTVVGDTGKAFDKLAINPGDTVFQFIDQICKYRAMFPLSDGVGGLILTSVSKMKSPGALIVGEDGNVISRSGLIDHRQRYSEIIVMGQADGGSFPDLGAEKLSASKGRAVDPDIKDYRPLIIIAEKEGYDLDMQARAEWEVRHRRFSGTELTYTVPGWEAAKSDLWMINSLVPVRDPQLSIARDMLISKVSLTRDDEGTTTQVTVAPAEAYDLPAMRQAEDDAMWGGGA